jgi:hypothetical protein
MSRPITAHNTRTVDKNQKNRANQPTTNPYFGIILANLRVYKIDGKKMVPLFKQALTHEKALAILKSIPYIPKEYQTLRGLSKIYGISRQTAKNYIDDYGNEILKSKGGGKK